MTNNAETFRALHQPGNPFILANAWDTGSALMMQGLGAKAIGTSSAALAFTLGTRDMGHITRDQALAHAEDMVAALDVPVSGDFENGFGHAPETCAETVILAAEVGLAGICIEDVALPADDAYTFDLAVERIRAAAAAARTLKKDFFLVARADGVMNDQYSVDEAIRRLQAFEAAGADGLYAPMPNNPDDLGRICKAVSLPVNVLAAGPCSALSHAQFAAAGAARISLGSALARATHRLIKDIGTDMFSNGDFAALGHSISANAVEKIMFGN